jgi:hypothetical protein
MNVTLQKKLGFGSEKWLYHTNECDFDTMRVTTLTFHQNTTYEAWKMGRQFVISVVLYGFSKFDNEKE